MMFVDMAGEQTPDSGESRVRTVPWERSPCAKNFKDKDRQYPLGIAVTLLWIAHMLYRDDAYL